MKIKRKIKYARKLKYFDIYSVIYFLVQILWNKNREKNRCLLLFIIFLVFLGRPIVYSKKKMLGFFDFCSIDIVCIIYTGKL
jgi:hypothetical protein